MLAKSEKPFWLRLRKYVITGLFVALPIWITWLVFYFLFRLVSYVGEPWVLALAGAWRNEAPAFSRFLLTPWIQGLCGILLVVLVLYVFGWAATQVAGARLLALFERSIGRIPLAEKVYGSSKQLVAALEKRPDGVQRVVLIEFPSPEMKTVGLVTRTFFDKNTGQELAAVYVPTTPNPTSGYLEIVPVEKLISTDWTVDDAMAFVISAGAVGPAKMSYSRSDIELSARI